MNQVTCYGMVRGRNWQQEHYETASRDAGRRTKQLREAGFRCFASSIGPQVTSVGVVKMSMVTVALDGDKLPPDPERIIRI